MEATEPAAAASCAAHEGAQATGTCARCGSFVCPLCLDARSVFPDDCAACRERRGAVLMAWERPEDGWPRRWARTVRDLIVRPTATFERTRPGGWIAPIAFNAVTALMVGVTVTVILACLVGGVFVARLLPALAELDGADERAMVAGLAALLALYPLGFVVSGLLTHAIVAGVFHLATRLLDGTGSVATSAWAVGYLSVGQLAMLPLSVASYVPVLGPFLALLGYVSVGVWLAVHLTTVARVHHGLEGGRALLAGWAPFLVAVGLATAGCALVVALALA